MATPQTLQIIFPSDPFELEMGPRTIGKVIFIVLSFRELLKCGKISNFRGLDIDLDTTCTGATKYLIFVIRCLQKSMKICIPRKFLALRYVNENEEQL